MVINPIPGTPGYLWQWTNTPEQNAASIGMAVAGINTTAMGAWLNTQAGVQTGVVFVPLLGRLQQE